MITLVHGYATDLTTPITKPKIKDGGFSAFITLLDRKQATLFRWHQPAVLKHLSVFSPTHHTQIYQKDRAIATNQQTAKRLSQHLTLTATKIVVAHSLGCELLLNTALQHQLPDQLEQLIFLQPDVDRTYFHDSLTKIKSKYPQLQLTHVYHPLDWTLWMSALLHGKLRAGLTPITAADRSLKFVSSIHPKVHTHSIEDQRILELLRVS